MGDGQQNTPLIVKNLSKYFWNYLKMMQNNLSAVSKRLQSAEIDKLTFDLEHHLFCMITDRHLKDSSKMIPLEVKGILHFSKN